MGADLLTASGLLLAVNAGLPKISHRYLLPLASHRQPGGGRQGAIARAPSGA